MPQIERITAWVVLLARREPLRLHREQQRLGATYRRFLLLSPDFIVDERGQAFIEEMNTNGFMPGDDALFRGQQDTVDALRVLGADGWPSRALYEERVGKLTDGFVAEQGYDAHDAAIVRSPLLELTHEEAAAFSTRWYRIFPPALPSVRMDALAAGLRESDALTELDEVTRDFLAYRLRTFGSVH